MEKQDNQRRVDTLLETLKQRGIVARLDSHETKSIIPGAAIKWTLLRNIQGQLIYLK